MKTNISLSDLKGVTEVKRKKGIVYYINRDKYLYLLLLLPILYFFIFKYIPMYGVIIAFKDYNLFQGIFGSKWIGFSAFKEVFAMNDFFRVVRNTLILNFLDLIFGFPAPIILALILSEIKYMWFKKSAQTILYLPHFLSWVIIGGIAYQLLSQNGFINNSLKAMGLAPIPFLTEKWHWLFTYVGVGVWQNAGWGTIIYLAAIAGINRELYDAADVDGAGRLRKIWHITLPGIKPTIIILLILSLGRMVSIGFERPYVIGNPLVSDFSEVISTFVYRIGLQSGNFTQATAVGLFQSVVSLMFLLTTNYIAEKSGESGIW
jgi:putative aldouronate transport system permease protein